MSTPIRAENAIDRVAPSGQDSQSSKMAQVAQESWGPNTSMIKPADQALKSSVLTGNVLDCAIINPYPDTTGLGAINDGLDDFNKSNALLNKALQELKNGDTVNGTIDLRRGMRGLTAGSADVGRGADGLGDLLSQDPDAQDGLNDGTKSIKQAREELMTALGAAKGGNTDCSVEQLTKALKDLQNGQANIGMAAEFLAEDKKDPDLLTPQKVPVELPPAPIDRPTGGPDHVPATPVPDHVPATPGPDHVPATPAGLQPVPEVLWKEAMANGFKPYLNNGFDADKNLRLDVQELMSMGYTSQQSTEAVATHEAQLGAGGRSIGDFLNGWNPDTYQPAEVSKNGPETYWKEAKAAGFVAHNDSGGDEDNNLREDVIELKNMGLSADMAVKVVATHEAELFGKNRSVEDFLNGWNPYT